MQAWNKGCKGCIYLGKLAPGCESQYCCDYFLITGQRRGCDPKNCERKLTGKRISEKDIEQKIRFLATDHSDEWLANAFRKEIPEIKRIVGDTPRVFKPMRLSHNTKMKITCQQYLEEKENGKTHKQIAEEYGCDKSTVSRAAKVSREGGTSR